VIFATVGTQLPFPRMLAALDGIAGERGLKVTAQTCEPGAHYAHMETFAAMAPAEFDGAMRDASVIVGHAGIGTLLGTGRLGKPLILMPRRASLGEHRNEHQLATVAAVQAREGIYVAMDEAELAAHLETPDLKPFHLGEGPKLPALTTFLRDFIHA